MSNDTEQQLIELTGQLLDSIAEADWETYCRLCDPGLSAFEPEGRGQLVEGMDFHRFYFERGAPPNPLNTTMSSPKVRLMGDVAVITCVRLVQSIGEDGKPVTSAFEETRVWQLQQDTWRHVHFHRSRPS